MIFWKGYGVLALVIAVVIGAIMSLLVKWIFGVNEDYGACAGTFISAIVIWIVGRKLNDPAKNRVMIDKATGREILFKPDHSLFFIKMQYWAFIVAGIGVIMLIQLIKNEKVSEF